MSKISDQIDPTFLPLVEACRAYGIGKTTAYELIKAELIETFTIGRVRYVVLESLRTLPERLKDPEKAKALSEVKSPWVPKDES